MVRTTYFIRFCFVVLTAAVSIWPRASQSATLFEGYYKILSEGRHIGYYIQRYSVDPKANTITSVSYLQTKTPENSVTESLKAVATNAFKPVSYQYTSKTGNQLRVIDAKFSSGKMKYSISNGSQKEGGEVEVSDKVFLSTFLGFLMLEQGYQVGKNFGYVALAEEDGIAVENAPDGTQKRVPAVHKGLATITKPLKHQGLDVLEVQNSFKGATFNTVVWSEAKGSSRRYEWLASESPLLGLGTELVKNPADATRGHAVPVKTLKLLFGDVPSGQKNVLHEKSAAESTGTAAPITTLAPNPGGEPSKGPSGP